MSEATIRPAPPMPAFTVTLSVGACEWDRLMDRMEEEVRHIREHGPDCKACWGGAGTHGHVTIQRRDITQEDYDAELAVWFNTEATP